MVRSIPDRVVWIAVRSTDWNEIVVVAKLPDERLIPLTTSTVAAALTRSSPLKVAWPMAAPIWDTRPSSSAWTSALFTPLPWAKATRSTNCSARPLTVSAPRRAVATEFLVEVRPSLMDLKTPLSPFMVSEMAK